MQTLLQNYSLVFQQNYFRPISFKKIEMCVQKIERPFTQFQYYRSEFDLCLVLEDLDPSGFGEIPLSPLSLFSNVQKIINSKDEQLIELFLNNKNLDKTPIDCIIENLKSQNDSQKLRTSNILQKMKQFHESPQVKQVSQIEEFFEKSKNNIFFALVTDVKNHQSQITNFFLNKKMLQFMGITNDMYLDYLFTEKTIPDPICKQNYLELWNDIMDSTIDENKKTDLYLDTYDGYHIPFSLFVNIGSIIDKEDNNSFKIVQIWNFIPKNDISWMLNPERIEKNKKDYFGQKRYGNQVCFQNFQEELGFLKPEKMLKRCNYSEISTKL